MTQVAFFPFWYHNPYHVRLASELATSGMTVNGCTTLPTKGAAPDVVHFHGFRFLLKGVSLEDARSQTKLLLSQLDDLVASGTAVVTTMHDLQNHLGLHLAVDDFLTLALLERSHVTVFHSESSRAQAARRWKGDWVDRSVIMPHPNYIGAYSNKISRKRARKQLKLDSKALVFLMLGSLRLNKGIESLLASFMAWKPKTMVRLVIAGANNLDSPHDKITEAAAADARVLYHPGYVEDGDLATYLNAADCAVLPFLEITTSGSLMLAMSFGLPVIAPRLPYFEDLLDEKGAVLYDPEDATSLTSSLELIWDRRDRLKAMGAHNFSIVEPWSPTEIGRQTRSVYQTALARTHLPCQSSNPN